MPSCGRFVRRVIPLFHLLPPEGGSYRVSRETSLPFALCPLPFALCPLPFARPTSAASAAEVRGNRHVAHGVQTGRNFQDLRDRVDGDRRRGHVAVDAAGDLALDIGGTGNVDRVVRL